MFCFFLYTDLNNQMLLFFQLKLNSIIDIASRLIPGLIFRLCFEIYFLLQTIKNNFNNKTYINPDTLNIKKFTTCVTILQCFTNYITVQLLLINWRERKILAPDLFQENNREMTNDCLRESLSSESLQSGNVLILELYR